MSYEYFVCTFQFSHLSLVRLSRSRRPPKDNESKKTRKTEIFLVLEIGSMVCLHSECLGECQRVICLCHLFAEIVCWECLIYSKDKITRCERCVQFYFFWRKIIYENFPRRDQVSDKKNWQTTTWVWFEVLWKNYPDIPSSNLATRGWIRFVIWTGSLPLEIIQFNTLWICEAAAAQQHHREERRHP